MLKSIVWHHCHLTWTALKLEYKDDAFMFPFLFSSPEECVGEGLGRTPFGVTPHPVILLGTAKVGTTQLCNLTVKMCVR